MKKLTAILALCFVACSNEPDKEAGKAPLARGTEACQEWRDSLCDFAADECKVIDRSACDLKYRNFSCASDGRAKECAGAYRAASCSTPPAECDFDSIADREDAAVACSALVRAICENTTKCSGGTVEACMSTFVGNYCKDVVGYSDGYEACLDAWAAKECILTEPSECKYVLAYLAE